MDGHMAQKNNKTENYATNLEQLFVFWRLEPPGPIALNYKFSSSKKLYTGTYVWQIWQWCYGITAWSVKLEYITQSHIHFYKTNKWPPVKPPLANRAISSIYVTLYVFSASTIEPQTNYQPQNNT